MPIRKQSISRVKSSIKDKSVNLPPSFPPPSSVQSSSSSSSSSSILGTIVQGMSFGAGSEVGHRVVRTILGETTKTELSSSPIIKLCQLEENNILECLRKENGSDNDCFDMYDKLKQCHSNKIENGTSTKTY